MADWEQQDDLRITPEQAKAMIDAGEALVLDVVASHVWPQLHRSVQGAVRIPPEEIASRVGELPRDRVIIAYCT